MGDGAGFPARRVKHVCYSFPGAGFTAGGFTSGRPDRPRRPADATRAADFFFAMYQGEESRSP